LAKPRQARYHHTTNGKWQGAAVARNNVLYLVVGALAVAVAVLGYQLYQDRKKPEGVNSILVQAVFQSRRNNGSDSMRAFIVAVAVTTSAISMSLFL